MSIWTIYSKEKKVLAEQKEFKSYIEANKYVAENYDKTFKAEVDPERWNEFKNHFIGGLKHQRFLYTRNGRVNAIKDGKGLFTSGDITVQEWVNLKHAGVIMKSLSNFDFIKKVLEIAN
jgi:hypothetical protein